MAACPPPSVFLARRITHPKSARINATRDRLRITVKDVEKSSAPTCNLLKNRSVTVSHEEIIKEGKKKGATPRNEKLDLYPCRNMQIAVDAQKMRSCLLRLFRMYVDSTWIIDADAGINEPFNPSICARS